MELKYVVVQVWHDYTEDVFQIDNVEAAMTAAQQMNDKYGVLGQKYRVEVRYAS